MTFFCSSRVALWLMARLGTVFARMIEVLNAYVNHYYNETLYSTVSSTFNSFQLTYILFLLLWIVEWIGRFRKIKILLLLLMYSIKMKNVLILLFFFRHHIQFISEQLCVSIDCYLWWRVDKFATHLWYTFHFCKWKFDRLRMEWMEWQKFIWFNIYVAIIQLMICRAMYNRTWTR